ncbi:PIR Superfamily Protein [Plasmodium ovale curtisi]|uniref:PIR Superfamily Protein n=1 Tax=Plasmodium ovale curtisi TaxID=864141 RepID=A0A1A8WJK9_PLAOA|nr:PIR Superfamily Protein [Plasmodium ovale curtisi]
MKLSVPNIKSMEQTKYDKIYKLYNVYEICRLFISNKHKTTACSLAKSCDTAYNKILTTYKKPDETIFCKALKNFAENLEANNFTSKIKCKQLVVSIGYQTGQTETQMESEGPSDPQKDKVVEIQANDTTSPRSFVTTLPISLFSSGAGVLLILLSFHKFTPLGKWLKLQTQRFGAITKNSDEELYEMQQPTSEYDERNTEYNVYNIAYNSL